MANDSGVWFDTKAEKVVKSQPEEGILLVAPGAEPTPDEQRRVDVYSGKVDDADETVTTKTADKKK